MCPTGQSATGQQTRNYANKPDFRPAERKRAADTNVGGKASTITTRAGSNMLAPNCTHRRTRWIQLYDGPRLYALAPIVRQDGSNMLAPNCTHWPPIVRRDPVRISTGQSTAVRQQRNYKYTPDFDPATRKRKAATYGDQQVGKDGQGI